MPAPAFTALPFVVYPVSDMVRARAFFAHVLGLHETATWEDKWVEYDIGQGTLALSSMMQGCSPGALGAAAALETPDFDAALAHLKAHGVRFLLEPIDSGICHFARFTDPEGNHLILHRAHAPQRPDTPRS